MKGFYQFWHLVPHRGARLAWSPDNALFCPKISSGGVFVCTYFPVGCAHQKGPEGSIVWAKTSLNPMRHSNPEILHFESEKNLHSSPVKNGGHPLKDDSVFATGGNAYFFGLQNALSQDWSVVGCSNLYRLTLWTLTALFGAHTPPKSMCTHRHTRLKIFDEKMHVFWSDTVSAPGGVPNVENV